MSNSNNVRLTYALESTFNTDPTNSADWNELRFTAESLKSDLTVDSSDEIRTSRAVAGSSLMDKATSGSIEGNLSYGTFDDFILAILGAAAFSAASSLVAAAAVSTTLATKTYAKDAGTWATNPAVGQWVYMSGFTNAASNGWHKVASVSGSVSFTVEEVIGADEAAVIATGGNLGQAVNGDTFTSFAFQREYTDLTNECARFYGCGVSNFDIDAKQKARIGVSIGIMGANEESSATLYDNITAANDNIEMTGAEHVQEVRENGASYPCTGYKVSLPANLRKQGRLGLLGAENFLLGDILPTGTYQAYFADSTAYDKFLNQEETSIALIVSDEVSAQGNAYIFDFPNIKITDAKRVTGGRNQDIIADLSFEAYEDANGVAVRVARLASA